MEYLELEDCNIGFAYIKEALTEFEPAPDYKADTIGMANLGKVIEFVKNDEYYETFEEKTAYLLALPAHSTLRMEISDWPSSS